MKVINQSLLSHTQIFKERSNQRLEINIHHHHDGMLISKLSNFRSSSGGAKRDRTVDLLRARQALSQLSYGPIFLQAKPHNNWWVWADSNCRPHPYQGCALTNWATDPIVFRNESSNSCGNLWRSWSLRLRRWSSRRFPYGYLVTTSPQSWITPW